MDSVNKFPGTNIDDNNLETKIISIRTVKILHPISPIQYDIQAHSIEKTILHLGGITKSIEDIGVKTIDKILVYQRIFFGKVRIVHMDQSEIIIDQISKKNTIMIKEFFENIIQIQRKNVVNITND